MKKTIGMAALILTTSFAQAKFVTTEDTAKQHPVQDTVQAKAEQKVKGFYLGVGVGSTTFDSLDIDYPFITEDGNTLKFMMGYQFNRVFALEGQHTTYGDIKESVSDYSWSPTAVSLSANLGYTFRNGLRPFGIVGLSNIDLGESSVDPDDDVSFGVRYGLGLEYAPVALRGFIGRIGYETDLFVINDVYYSDSESYTLGSFYGSVTYKF